MFEDGVRRVGGDGAAGASGARVSVLERAVAGVVSGWAPGVSGGAPVTASALVPVVVEAAGARLELFPPAPAPVLVLDLDAARAEAVPSSDAASTSALDIAPAVAAPATDAALASAATADGVADGPAVGDAGSVPWWAVVPTGAAPVPGSGVLPSPGDPALAAALGRGLGDREADAVGASVLEALPGGPVLAALLAPLVPGGLGEASLVETVAGFERVASWAIAMQAACVRELTDRQGLTSKAADRAAAEIAARLGSTNAVGSAKVNLAAALDSYPEVADALATGRIDIRKANVLTAREPGLSVREHRRVVTGLLRDADRISGPRLRHRLRAAALSVDPGAGAARREEEHQGRQVRVTAAADGMAWVTAYLRADKAHTVKVALKALTEAARDGDDTDGRTRAQVEADAFVDLFAAVLDRGVDLAGHPLPSAPGRAGAQITVGAGTLLGLDGQAGYLAGYGPIPAELAREIAQDATWRALLTDRDGHFKDLSTRAYRPGKDLSRTVRARDITCTFPGCNHPSVVCDLDHRIEYDPAIAHLVKQTSSCNLHPLCRRHHNLKTTRRWDVIREKDGTLLWIPARTGHQYRHTPDPPAGAPSPTGRWTDLYAGAPPF